MKAANYIGSTDGPTQLEIPQIGTFSSSRRWYVQAVDLQQSNDGFKTATIRLMSTQFGVEVKEVKNTEGETVGVLRTGNAPLSTEDFARGLQTVQKSIRDAGVDWGALHGKSDEADKGNLITNARPSISSTNDRTAALREHQKHRDRRLLRHLGVGIVSAMFCHVVWPYLTEAVRFYLEMLP